MYRRIYLYIVILLIGLSSIIAFPQIKVSARTTLSKPPNNLGLVGYWSFNEGGGTTATDFSGNENTGTLTGGPAWTSGKFGRALSFDGSNNIAISTPHGLNITSVTQSAWVYFPVSVTAGWQTIVEYGRYGLNHYGLWKSNNANAFHCNVNETTIDFTTIIVPKTWYHVACTFDQISGNIYIYLNGIQEGTIGNASLSSNSSPMTIGSNNDPDEFFPGKIDEVRIYSRALSATEIAKLYQSGAVKFNASSVELQRGSSLEKGLVGHWTFDGPDVTDKVYDRSGQGNNGYLLAGTDGSFTGGGPTSTAKTIGKLGQALNFFSAESGNNTWFEGSGYAVQIPHSASFASSPMSYSVWVKAKRFNKWQGIVSKRISDGNEFVIEIKDTADYYACGSWTNNNYTAGSVTTVTQTANIWTHLVCTVDGINGTVRLYVNGVLENTYSPAAWDGTTNTAAITIGKRGEIDDGTGFFDGSIDDVRVYSRALSATEAKQLYNLGVAKIR
jgi:Concanavalin A-like lectin/glucanases superfamily